MKNRREIVTYEQLLTINQSSNSYDLCMVPVNAYNIRTNAWKNDMEQYTGSLIYVRETVAKKLQRINLKLKNERGLEIAVAYGYRHPSIQQKYFDAMLQKLHLQNNSLTDSELYSEVHKFVAVPQVAGHPTGGAVDVTLSRNNNDLDLGSIIADFTDPSKIPTFSKCVSTEQRKNRMILRKYMLAEGFAPFNGEWWHFSFGDREWAFWHKLSKSIFSQIEFILREFTHTT